MHRMQSRALSLLLLAVAGMASATEPRLIAITADSYFFKPDTIVVKVGETVTLSVTSEAIFLPHNLIIKAPQAGLDVDIEVKAGQTASATFTPTTPGTYEMYCGKEPPFGKNHRERGMHGRLIVE